MKKEIFELSRLEKIDLDKLTKLKAAKAMEAAAENPSGTAGMGVGLGAGIAMAQQMTQNMMNPSDRQNGQNTPAPPRHYREKHCTTSPSTVNSPVPITSRDYSNW